MGTSRDGVWGPVEMGSGDKWRCGMGTSGGVVTWVCVLYLV